MDYAALFAVFIGVCAFTIGWRIRSRGGIALMLIGGAFMVGPLSPLTRGVAPDSVRVVFSRCAILLAVAAVTYGLLTWRPWSVSRLK